MTDRRIVGRRPADGDLARDSGLAPSHRSFIELLRSLVDDSRALLQQEIALARLEFEQTASGIIRGSISIVLGVGIVAVGLLVLVAFLVVGLVELLDWAYWLSTLVVGATLTIIGGIVLAIGLRRLSRTGVRPEQTTASLRETKSWAQEELRDLKRDLVP